jgi:hypothetical protein
MYVQKAPNAAGSKISVTTTAANIFDLINTAASTTDANAGYTHTANAVMIQPEDGDIRILFDGNTPTSTNGFLVQSNSVGYFPNMPLKKLQLISTTGTVVCSVMVGQSNQGENVTMDSAGSGGGITSDEVQGNAAHDAPDVGNPIKIGGYATAADRADVSTEGDRVDASFDLAGYIRSRSKAYDTSSQADKQVEQAPIYTHHTPLLQVEVTNETNGTNNRRVNVSSYDQVILNFNGVAGNDTITLTIEASSQDDGTDIASAAYEDISQYGVTTLTQALGAANYTDDVMFLINVKGMEFLNVKTVSTGGNNDGDYNEYLRAAY